MPLRALRRDDWDWCKGNKGMIGNLHLHGNLFVTNKPFSEPLSRLLIHLLSLLRDMSLCCNVRFITEQARLVTARKWQEKQRQLSK